MNKRIRVLIVEDMEDDALLLAAELERGGFEVEFERVDTATAMRTAIEREKWDAILCDYTMPYFSGRAALHVAREFAPDVPFLYVSGTIGEDAAIEAMKSGAQDYVMKANLARLVPATERALREAEIRRETQRAERAMRESENKYRHLFEALGDAILLIDEASGRIIDANTRAERLLCRTRGEILGLNQAELFLPHEGQSTFTQLCAAIAAERIATCEMHISLPAGAGVPVQASGSEIELSGHRLLLTVLRDVTERNRMEEQLRQLSRAVEQSPASVIVTDTAAQIQYVNSTFTALTGYTYAEAVGQNPRMLKSGQTPPETYRQLWDTITAGKTWRGEFHNKKKNGELYWELASISPIFSGSGQITNYLAVKEDITERKRTEEALRLFRHVVDQSLDAVTVVDPATGCFLDVNEAACQMFQYSRKELLQRSVPDLAPTLPDQKTWQQRVQQLQAGHEELHESQIRCKDGNIFPVEVSSRFVKVGDGSCIIAVLRDITKRKHAEEALRNSEERHRVLFESSKDAFMTLGPPDWRFTSANRSTLEMFRTRTVAEFLAKAPWELSPETQPDGQSSAKKAREMIETAMRDGSHYFEWTHQRFDGEVFPATVLLTRLELKGQMLLNASVRDITRQRRAEEALQKSEERLNLALAAAEMGVWEWQLSDNQVIWSPQCRKILKIEPAFDAFINSVHPEDRPRILEAAKHAIATHGILNVEYRVVEPEGGIRWLSATARASYDASDKPLRMVGTLLDITQRKRAEEKVAEQAALLDKAQDAIIVRDLNNHIVYWNKSAERIFGWNASETVAKNIVEVLRHDPVKYDDAQKAVLQNGEWNGETTVFTKDGHEVLVEARWTLVRDAHGNPESILSINTDITEQKKFEAKFLRSQRMESIGTLAGGIAHDLNNIFTPLMISVGMLRDGLKTPEMLHVLDILEANVQRGTNLVKQVLAFGRGIKGERIPVKVTFIVREIEEIIRETFPKSIEFQFSRDPGIWMVIGDATQLHQVLLNLCVNARDAMPEGGKLTIDAKNVVLDDHFVRANPGVKTGPFVMLSVSDSGTGIPKEIQERIFDPFFTTKAVGKGTGLGLSTAHSIIHGHGGFIHCYSEVGHGTTFRVYLPASRESANVPQPSATEPKSPAGHGELVLVVDDEEPVREMVKKTLEFYGYRVLVAGNGAEAIALYKSHPEKIEAVISDIAMPVMGGAEMISALKTIDPEAKIILSSGFSSDENVEKATAAGVSCFIPKPYSAKEILQALHNLLQ